MSTESINPATSNTVPSAALFTNCAHGCAGSCHQRVNNIVVYNDQNILKGVLWGAGAFKAGSATLGLAGATLVYSPLVIVPVFAAIPFTLGLATIFAGSVASACFDNACYHLGSRQVKVIHTY